METIRRIFVAVLVFALFVVGTILMFGVAVALGHPGMIVTFPFLILMLLIFGARLSWLYLTTGTWMSEEEIKVWLGKEK